MEALQYTFKAHKILERLGDPNTQFALDNLKNIKETLGDKEYEVMLGEVQKAPEI